MAGDKIIAFRNEAAILGFDKDANSMLMTSLVSVTQTISEVRSTL